MRACGTVERRSFMWSMPGKDQSSAKRVCPVTRARPSTRRSGWPTTASFGVSAMVVPVVRRAYLRRERRLPAQHARRRLDGLEDLEVARATAELAGERFRDLRARRGRVALEELQRRDEEARRAVAALRRAVVGEGVLERGGIGP